MSLSIGITTFQNRKENVFNLIKQIRSFNKVIPIQLIINVNYQKEIDEEYKKDILYLIFNKTGLFFIHNNYSKIQG